MAVAVGWSGYFVRLCGSAGLKFPVWAVNDYQTAKTVVLHTPDGYRFAVIPAADRLDLNKAAAALDVSRHQLRLATEADMATDFADYEVGALPPVGPDTPAELIDPRLLAFQRVLCSGGDHEHSLLVDPADIVRLTGARTADIRED